MHSRGALIVVEGIDRSGKSTQCSRLVQALRKNGHQVKGLKFPGSNNLPFSVVIRSLHFVLNVGCMTIFA